MTAHNFVGTAPFIILGSAGARLLPRRLLYGLGRRAARRMSRKRTRLFLTLRENLDQVVGPGADDATLDQMAEEALYHAGCTYIDMLRQAPRDVQRGRIPIRVDPEAWEPIKAGLCDERGTVLVGPHLSNFDLAAQWIAAQGFEIQGLSLPKPDAGGRGLNRLRLQRGIRMTPISHASLRSGTERLRAGGVCMTGVDRPASDSDPLTPFFGRLAHMPTGHVKLALQTNSRVLVACCLQSEDGVYELRLAPMLEMEKTGNRGGDVRRNVSRVLEIIEDMIRQAPAQWLMFVPVWRNACGAGESTAAPCDPAHPARV